MSSMMSGDSVHDDSPQRKNESEMIQQQQGSSEQKAGSGAHVPKLLLTEAPYKFAHALANKSPSMLRNNNKANKEGNSVAVPEGTHLISMDTNYPGANAQTNATDSINHMQNMMLSQEPNELMINQEQADEQAERIFNQPDDGQTPLGIIEIDSPAKKINPMFNNDHVVSEEANSIHNDDS